MPDKTIHTRMSDGTPVNLNVHGQAWHVYRRPKRKGASVESMGKFYSEKDARNAMKEMRANDQYKTYTWSVGKGEL